MVLANYGVFRLGLIPAIIILTASFRVGWQASEAGATSVSWYVVARGAHLARKPKPVLLGSAQWRVTTSPEVVGTFNWPLRFTAQGKRLIKRSKRLRIVVKETFTPLGEAPVTVTAPALVTRACCGQINLRFLRH
jgi:hypothetical protein